MDDAIQTTVNKSRTELSQIVFGRWIRWDSSRLIDRILRKVKTWTDVDWIDLSDGTAYFRKSNAADLNLADRKRLKEVMRYTKENVKDVDISTIVFKVPGGKSSVDPELAKFLEDQADSLGVTVRFEETFSTPPS